MLSEHRKQWFFESFVNSISKSSTKESIIVKIYDISKHVKEPYTFAEAIKSLGKLTLLIDQTVNCVISFLLAVVISVKISKRVPQSMIKMMSKGSRNDGKQAQLIRLTIIRTVAIDPTVSVK